MRPGLQHRYPPAAARSHFSYYALGVACRGPFQKGREHGKGWRTQQPFRLQTGNDLIQPYRGATSALGTAAGWYELRLLPGRRHIALPYSRTGRYSDGLACERHTTRHVAGREGAACRLVPSHRDLASLGANFETENAVVASIGFTVANITESAVIPRFTDQNS